VVRLLLKCAFASLVVLGAAVSVTGAAAQDFYAGKTVNHYIGFGPGGGYDLYGRLFARHIGRFLPGKPTIVAQNMPGAGGLKVANFMYAVAPKDGTALATTAEGAVIEQTLGGQGVEYDATKFNWIGMMTPSVTLFFTWHTSATKSFEDLRKRQTFFGSSGAGNTDYIPKALNKLAGAQFKLITGYRGSADVMLAVERGELEGAYALWTELKERRSNWLAEKTINPIIFIAAKRQPEYPDVPIVKEVGLTDEGRAILGLLSVGEVGRSVFTTPGVPVERVALLRRAFGSMVADREFLDEARKAGLTIEPMGGEELQAMVAGVTNAPRDLVKKAEAARN